MLHKNLISQEYYSYEDEQEIKRIIQIDSIGIVEFFSEDQWIEYTVDRNYCIRLSDLIHQIEQNLIRFHFGQLLDLIQLLLCRIVELEDKKIQHDYLDMNRIWLQLDEQSQKPNIIYQKLLYDIHFTGYQCPFYEQLTQQNQNINMKNKMRLIIKEIIQRCYRSIQYLRTDQMYLKELEQNIIQPLIEKVESLQFEDIISEIAIIKLEKQYEGNDQSLDFDNKFQDNVGSERAKWILKLNEDIESIVIYSTNYQILVVECLLNFYLPQFTQMINKKYKRQNISFDYIQQSQKIYELQRKQKKEQNKYFEQIINSTILSQLNDYQNIAKFEISEQSLSLFQKKIIENIKIHPLNKYFNNTHWLYINNTYISDQIRNEFVKIIEATVKEYIKNQAAFEISELVIELI